MRTIDRLLDPTEVARKRAMLDRLRTENEPRPTSLVPTYQSVASDEAPDRCPNALDWQWRNLDTGEVRPDRCKRNGCAYCCSINAWRRAMAITYANPERYIVLTQVGPTWEQRRSRVKDVTRDLRHQLGKKLQWCWTVEPNPKGTGYHLNAYQYGDFIPQAELSRIATRRGMGEVTHIQRIRHSGRAAGYGLKLAGAPSYGLKEAEALETAERYLAANGGRLTHQTRGFWRHPHGETIDRVRDAEKYALAAHFGAPDGEWVRERVRGESVKHAVHRDAAR